MPTTLPTPSSFTETFVALNCPEVSACFRWSFQPGMLFQDNVCWWKPARRTRPHEGVDLCGYHAGIGVRARKVGTDLVPSLYDGVVVQIDDDFLGKTVWMAHESIRNDKLILFSGLGHITPQETLTENAAIGQGEAVGRIAPRKKDSLLAMHLHCSVFWAPPYLQVERLSWQDLPTSKVIRLFDPLAIISRRA